MSNKEELTLKAELQEPQARDGALFVGSVTSQATFDKIVSKVIENQQTRQPFHPIQQALHDLQHPMSVADIILGLDFLESHGGRVDLGESMMLMCSPVGLGI